MADPTLAEKLKELITQVNNGPTTAAPPTTGGTTQKATSVKPASANIDYSAQNAAEKLKQQQSEGRITTADAQAKGLVPAGDGRMLDPKTYIVWNQDASTHLWSTSGYTITGGAKAAAPYIQAAGGGTGPGGRLPLTQNGATPPPLGQGPLSTQSSTSPRLGALALSANDKQLGQLRSETQLPPGYVNMYANPITKSNSLRNDIPTIMGGRDPMGASQALSLAVPDNYNPSNIFQQNDRGSIGLGNWGGKDATLDPLGYGNAQIQTPGGPGQGFSTNALLSQYGYRSTGDPYQDSLLGAQLLGEQQRMMGSGQSTEQVQRALEPGGGGTYGSNMQVGQGESYMNQYGQPETATLGSGGGISFTHAAKGMDRTMSDPFMVINARTGEPIVEGSEFGQNERLRINPMRGNKTLPIDTQSQPGMDMAMTGYGLQSNQPKQMGTSTTAEDGSFGSLTPEPTQPTTTPAPAPTPEPVTSPLENTNPVPAPVVQPQPVDQPPPATTPPGANPINPATTPGVGGGDYVPPGSGDMTGVYAQATQRAKEEHQRQNDAYKYRLAGVAQPTPVQTNTLQGYLGPGLYSTTPDYSGQYMDAQNKLNLLGPTGNLSELINQYGAAQNSYYNATDDATRARALAERERLQNEIFRAQQAQTLGYQTSGLAGATPQTGIATPGAFVNTPTAGYMPASATGSTTAPPTQQTYTNPMGGNSTFAPIQPLQQASQSNPTPSALGAIDPTSSMALQQLATSGYPQLSQQMTQAAETGSTNPGVFRGIQSQISHIEDSQARATANNALALLIGSMGRARPGPIQPNDPLAILARTKFAA